MKTSEIALASLETPIVYFIGENSKDNFYILDKASGDDIWFHANDVSSCHVIATNLPKLSKKEKNSVIKKGALLCKQNTSKLKSIQSQEYVYTKFKNVTKTSTPGSVLTCNTKTIII